MVLALPLLIERDIAEGTVVQMPGFDPVNFGRYRVLISAWDRNVSFQLTAILRLGSSRAQM